MGTISVFLGLGPAGTPGLHPDRYTGRYPAVAAGPVKTRADVVAEVREARRNGDLMAAGDADLTLREVNPARYRSTASRTAAVPSAEQRAANASAGGPALR